MSEPSIIDQKQNGQIFTSVLKETLHFIGFNRLESTVLAHILNNGPSRSIDIVFDTCIAQPQVSLALKSLCEQGWINFKRASKGGRGRPIHYYDLSMSRKSLYGIIKTMEENRIEEIRTNYEILGKVLMPTEQIGIMSE